MERLKHIIFVILFCAAIFGVPSQVVAQGQVTRSSRTVRVEGKQFYVHTVKRKETLYSIAKAYQVTEAQLIQQNDFLIDGLKAGATLLIPIPTKDSDLVPLNGDTKAKEVGDGGLHKLDTSADAIAQEQNVERENGVEKKSVLGVTRDFDISRGVNMALLLPFEGSVQSNDANFVDFMQGSILAMATLKEEGVQLNVNVLSTSKSASGVSDLIDSGALDEANIIIGPVYDEPFNVVGRWAAERCVPIVSPLGGTGSLNNPYTVAIAPVESAKYDRLKSLRLNDPTANYILVESGRDMDEGMLAEMKLVLPSSTKYLKYEGKATLVSQLSDLLDRDLNNVIVMPIMNENLAEEILTRFSSINSMGRYPISVVGSSRWARFTTINFDLFFKMNVSYTTSYHSDRGNERVVKFTNDYINAFGVLPTMYSMRGYDVVLLFGRLMNTYGRDMLLRLPYFKTDLLQVNYDLHQGEGVSSKFENRLWPLVTYNSDYTISVE